MLNTYSYLNPFAFPGRPADDFRTDMAVRVLDSGVSSMSVLDEDSKLMLVSSSQPSLSASCFSLSPLDVSVVAPPPDSLSVVPCSTMAFSLW